jgi:hypothetical protein
MFYRICLFKKNLYEYILLRVSVIKGPLFCEIVVQIILKAIQKHCSKINIFYKTFPGLIYKQFLCYDVTITTGLLSRLRGLGGSMS